MEDMWVNDVLSKLVKKISSLLCISLAERHLLWVKLLIGACSRMCWRFRLAERSVIYSIVRKLSINDY